MNAISAPSSVTSRYRRALTPTRSKQAQCVPMKLNGLKFRRDGEHAAVICWKPGAALTGMFAFW